MRSIIGRAAAVAVAQQLIAQASVTDVRPAGLLLLPSPCAVAGAGGPQLGVSAGGDFKFVWLLLTRTLRVMIAQKEAGAALIASRRHRGNRLNDAECSGQAARCD